MLWAMSEMKCKRARQFQAIWEEKSESVQQWRASCVFSVQWKHNWSHINCGTAFHEACCCTEWTQCRRKIRRYKKDVYWKGKAKGKFAEMCKSWSAFKKSKLCWICMYGQTRKAFYQWRVAEENCGLLWGASDDFKNKKDILNRIKEMPLSTQTVQHESQYIRMLRKKWKMTLCPVMLLISLFMKALT